MEKNVSNKNIWNVRSPRVIFSLFLGTKVTQRTFAKIPDDRIQSYGITYKKMK